MASPNQSQEITIPARSLGQTVETPFGTDFSLELSGALESDAHDHLSSKDAQMDDFASIVMLDPEVLASLIIQLRTNLSSAARERDLLRGERDELIRDLVITQTRLQDLEGSQEREVQLLNEMASWRKRAEDAEEQVAMLRGKVEESRRAVMTLQTQSRRLSQLTSGSPHASPLTQTTFGTASAGSDGNTLRSPFQKRMSLQPAAPGVTPSPNPRRGHRRERSLTDITSSVTSGESELAESSAQDPGASPPRPPSRRQSTAAHTRPTESLLNPYAAEMESLRQELISVRMELIEAKQEAWEASEAKEASDVCLKALKEFIAENSIGDGAAKADATGDAPSLRGLSLPPLPTDRIDDEEGMETPVATHAHSASVSSRKGWGLGFWSSAPTPAAPSEPAPPVAPNASSGSPVVSPSSQSQATCTKSPPPPPPAQPAGAFSSFVSRWKRTDSTTSPPAPVTPAVSSSIASAFRWSQASSSPSSTSPNAPTENDSYTPAPRPGNLKRRPSAYSVLTTSTKSEISDRDSVRKETLFSYENTHDSMLSTIPLDAIGEIQTSPIEMTFSPQETMLGDASSISTPSLTDVETITTASGHGSISEPESPESTQSPVQGRLLTGKRPPSLNLVDAKSEVLVSVEVATPRTPVPHRPSPSAGNRSRSSSVSAKGQDIPPVPIPPVPTNPFVSRSSASSSPASSPKMKSLGVGSPAEGRKRARSRAASNAMMTIEEASAAKTEQTVDV